LHFKSQKAAPDICFLMKSQPPSAAHAINQDHGQNTAGVHKEVFYAERAAVSAPS